MAIICAPKHNEFQRHQGIDPLHIGPNQVVMNYFNSFPHANDLTAGDQLNFIGLRFRGPTLADNNWYIVDYKSTRAARTTYSGVVYCATISIQILRTCWAMSCRTLSISAKGSVGYTAACDPRWSTAFTGDIRGRASA
jgi:hypothetical protein